MLSFIRMLFNSPDDASGQAAAASDAYVEQIDAHAPDDLAIAAVNRGSRSQFIELLATHGVWVIIRLDQAEFEGDVHLLEYDEGDRRILPIFSSVFEAAAFVHTIDISEMLPLQYMHVPASFLTHNDLSGHKVVMNPYAGATTEIQEPDLAGLRSMFGEQY